jgi:3-oxoacyl-[acyl-carrier-protein] synthase I
MSDTKKLYIAGMGMITPVGGNVAMTAASVKAGISGYKVSDFYNQHNQPITMASVPDVIIDKINAEIGEGNRFNACHDRVVKMAIIAIREACESQQTKQAIPLILAMPDVAMDTEGLSPLIENLERNCLPWIGANQCRSMYSGRAAGMEAIEFAFRYLYEAANDFFLIGGSDSYQDYSRLNPLCNDNRLNVPGSADGFVPGEAACFLLLTRRREFALKRDGHIIALHPPGMAEESGHMSSEEPYRGEGLDQAFKHALLNHPKPVLHSIYSSMNGENHWAKEYGVASTRNRTSFIDQVKTEHPADCYGDLGAATSPVLIALAAENLFNHAEANMHLVYSSSDSSKRGAIVVERLAIK